MIEKIAITGGPGSGKSSTIRVLEYEWKERTIAEAAEDIIKTLRKQGYEKPWELPDFQDRILRLQIQREAQVENLKGRVFIDRGIIDGLAYYQIREQTSTEAMKKAMEDSLGRYKKVFLMEQGNKCENNGIRWEDLDEARKLQELQYENYTKAGYKVERLAYSLGMEGRAKRILDLLEEENVS